MSSRPIRFGILYDGSSIARWQLSALEQLCAVPEVSAVLLIAVASPSGDSHSIGHAMAGSGGAAGRALGGGLPPDRVSIAQGRWAGLEQVTLDAGAPTSTTSIDRIRHSQLEFILSLVASPLPAQLLDSARYGVWRYQFGDWINDRDSFEGFREVYERRAVSAAMLVHLLPDPDAVTVLREGYLRTELLSISRNRRQLLDRFTHWPAQVCRDMRNDVVTCFTEPALKTNAPAPSRPTSTQRLVCSLRIALRLVGAGLSDLFRHDQWNVGVIDQPIAAFARSGGRAPIRWLPTLPRTQMRADPFGVSRDGHLTIVCEQMNSLENVGTIVAIDAETGAATAVVGIGPQPPVHLSYPFLLQAGGQVWCVPETQEAEEVALYSADHFPDRWRKVETLTRRSPAVDGTVFEHEGTWWLAASQVAPKGANSELHLWHSKEMTGPWTAHTGNPVKIDVRSARPAGTPYVEDGVLYRPAQDCAETYGARVVVNRVVTLTPTAFVERQALVIDPDPSGPYPRGLHTVSQVGDRTLIDGKRQLFIPAQFRRTLAHSVRRALHLRR